METLIIITTLSVILLKNNFFSLPPSIAAGNQTFKEDSKKFFFFTLIAIVGGRFPTWKMIRDPFSISINFLYGDKMELDALPKFSDLYFSHEDRPNMEDSAGLSQTIEEGDEETIEGDTEELGKLKKGEHLLAPMIKLGGRSQKKLKKKSWFSTSTRRFSPSSEEKKSWRTLLSLARRTSRSPPNQSSLWWRSLLASALLWCYLQALQVPKNFHRSPWRYPSLGRPWRALGDFLIKKSGTPTLSGSWRTRVRRSRILPASGFYLEDMTEPAPLIFSHSWSSSS